jgi:hypothetical protein
MKTFAILGAPPPQTGPDATVLHIARIRIANVPDVRMNRVA